MSILSKITGGFCYSDLYSPSKRMVGGVNKDSEITGVLKISDGGDQLRTNE
jgi:hypothetical protein